MAQQGRNGHHDENGADGSYIFNPMAYNYSQHQAFSPPTVLSQQDATLMADFFNNPDTSNTGDAFASYGMDSKNDNNFHMAHHNALTSDAALTNVHAQASHAAFTSHHMPQANRMPFNTFDYTSSFLQNNHQPSNNNHSAGDAVAGASALLGLSTSQEQATLLGANNYMTWPNIVGAHLQAPITHSPTAIAPRNPPVKSNSTSQLQNQIQSPPTQVNTWADIQARELQQRARHPSLQLDTSNTHFPTHQNAWQNAPMSAAPHARRPPMVKFGSDSTFGENGFTGTAMPQQDKQNNLMHMATAGDLASAQGQRTPHVPALVHRHSIAGGMPMTQSTHRSPVMVGGLATPTQQLQTPFHTGFNAGMTAANTSRKRNFNQIDNSNVTQSTIALAEQVSNLPENKRRASSGANGAAKANSRATRADSGDSTTTPQTTRRRNAQREPRAPRQNLTDAQKRQNHIASEQKRRDTMKTNYDILSQRVPSVRDGGAMSRSEILFHVATHMEAMVAGNTVMCRLAGITLDQLDDMPDTDDEEESGSANT